MSRPIEIVGIVVPAHDEAELIGECLAALTVAARSVAVGVRALVVLDDCHDGTARVCERQGVDTLAVALRNVGAARAYGFTSLMDTVRQERPALAAEALWLATTDADTCVAPDWLQEQIALADHGADAVLGVIDVNDWTEHPARVRDRFAQLYDGAAPGDGAGHRHVHGASLGIRMSTYLSIGGMPAVCVGEDQALADLLAADPRINVARTTKVRAMTSARRTSRIVGGFATLLASLA